MRRLTISILAAGILCSLDPTIAAAQDGVRTEQVFFPAGTTGTTISDSVTGRASVDYKVGAESGQTLRVRLTSDNTATYFNVYAPGTGPGDAALAVGSLTGPMMVDLNRFEGVLPVSGVYTISVYLFRNAARRGETSNYMLDLSITGETGEIVQGDFADGLQGGPDFWNVRTSGAPLNLRKGPSAGADLVSSLANGTPLRNLGCRMAEGRRWCRVATLSDPGFEGWVAGDFLVEGSGDGAATQLPDVIPVPGGGTDALVPGTDYNATGSIECVRGADGPVESCGFGVVRQGRGTGVITVEWPDGGSRVIFFEAGKPVSFDQSQADQGVEMTIARDQDNSIVFIGEDRFVIPDAVIWGG